MSTRCHIAFYESSTQALLKPTILLYKHHDGYPGTNGIPDLILPFLRAFKESRGLRDIEYCSAQLLHFMLMRRDCGGIADHSTEALKLYQYTGFGICRPDNIHADIDYLYRIDSDTSKLLVYSFAMGCGINCCPPSQTDLIEAHDI